MEWIDNNLAVFYLIVGLVIIGIDIVIVGLSPLAFVAVGALLTALLLYITGWQLSFMATLALCAVLSFLLALVGQRPLKQFQNSNVQEDNSSDLIGRTLVTTEEVTKVGGLVNWSGTQWRARLADDAPSDSIGAGVKVKVLRVVDLSLILEPVS